MIDRSLYLNSIIYCIETFDSCVWLNRAKSVLGDPEYEYLERLEEAAHCVRMALWNYEARAYRRKQEKVNREKPSHDDSARPRPWRKHICDDVPFDHHEIELRSIGEDGHILLIEDYTTC